jgi:hypothetical protein
MKFVAEQLTTWEIKSWVFQVWGFLSMVAKEFIILGYNANSVSILKNILRGKAVVFSSRADNFPRKVTIPLPINS